MSTGKQLFPLLFVLTGCAAGADFPGYTEGESTTKHDAGVAFTDANVTAEHTIPSGDAGKMTGVGTSSSHDAGTADVSTGLANVIVVEPGDAYNTAPVCTSGMTWALGNTKSALMNPGLGCDTCHFLGGSASGYEFDLAGTVYPAAHEPDLCDGVAGASIVITDANGAAHTLAVNSAGNFYNFDYLGVGAIPTPYKAKVVWNGLERPMLTPQTNGDCNSCHTEQGTMAAPGRVMMP
jgi:hypothetical protein